MDDNLNLKPERGPNVWDRPYQPRDKWKSEVGGAMMLAAGAAAAFMGGRMLYRAVCDAPCRTSGKLNESNLDDIVGEESAQSFPASDSPSWTSSAGAEKGERSR